MHRSKMFLVLGLLVLVGGVGFAVWSRGWNRGRDDTAVGFVSTSTPGGVVVDNAPTEFPILRATNPEEVREVLRLTRSAADRDRTALRHAALTSDDPLVVGNAVKALGRLQTFASDPALLSLIADPRLRVRQDAVMACGFDGSTASIPHLETAFAKKESAVQPLILQALGQIGGPTATALVDRVASDPEASKTERVFARVARERMK